MLRNIFVSYDLHNPGQNYQALIDKIKSLGSWAKVHKSFWYLSSSLTYDEIFEKIRPYMDENDSLMVIDASSNDAIWYGLQSDASAHIKSHWNVAIKTI